MKKIILLLTGVLPCLFLNSQVRITYSENGDVLKRADDLKGVTFTDDVYILPSFDLSSYEKEDVENDEIGAPYRFGTPHDTSLTLADGTWKNVENGRLWAKSFYSKGASSLNFIFDDFHLSDNGVLYIINEDETVLFGPVLATSIPQSGHFMSDVIPGEKVTILLFEPFDEIGTSSLMISRIVHGYRHIYVNPSKKMVENRSEDNIDVACWSQYYDLETYAIGVFYNPNGFQNCTGALVQTAEYDYKPYFLTAFHCLDADDSKSLSTNEKLAVSGASFKFCYKKKTCDGDSILGGYLYQGAEFKSAWVNTDFALLRITNSNLSSNPLLSWLGWSRSQDKPSYGTCLHHPHGTPMKIALEDDEFNKGSSSIYGNNIYWKVQMDVGALYNGSSGCPILDDNDRVVGQLIGDNGNGYDMFGILGKSWNGGGTNDTGLKNWLDSCNTNTWQTDTRRRSYSMSIVGPSLICQQSSGIYTVSNIPSGVEVTWTYTSLIGNSPHSIRTNYPVANACTVEHVYLTNSAFTGRLTAELKYDDIVFRTLTKEISGDGNFYGFYWDVPWGDGQPYIWEMSLTTEEPNEAYAENTVCVESPNLVGKTIYLTTNSYPSGASHTGTNPFYFMMPTLAQGEVYNMFISNYECGGYVRVQFINATYGLQNNRLAITPLENGQYSVTMQNNGSDSQGENSRGITDDTQDVLAIDVTRLSDLQKVSAMKVLGNNCVLDGSDWPSGAYVVTARCKGEKASAKIIK